MKQYLYVEQSVRSGQIYVVLHEDNVQEFFMKRLGGPFDSRKKAVDFLKKFDKSLTKLSVLGDD